MFTSTSGFKIFLGKYNSLYADDVGSELGCTTGVYVCVCVGGGGHERGGTRGGREFFSRALLSERFEQASVRRKESTT